MDALEQTHWWFAGRRAIVFDLLQRYAPFGRVLDIGLGTGLNAAHLVQRGYRVDGIEPSADAIALAQKKAPGIAVIQDSFPSAQVQEEAYDVVLMLDVLEHLSDDSAGLAAVQRALRPGGVVLITVPAFGFLWSGHDVLAHHHRRYCRRELRHKLAAAGLIPLLVSYYNFFLFPAIALVRIVQKLLRVHKQQSDFSSTPGWLNWPLARLFGAERYLLRLVWLPVGVSLVGVARKPQ